MKNSPHRASKDLKSAKPSFFWAACTFLSGRERKKLAQASMEFLLLIAMLLGFFAFLAPKILQAYDIMVFASEAQKAKALCEKLSTEADKIFLFENSSSTKIRAFPELKWKINAKESEISVRIESQSLEKQKTINCSTTAQLKEFEKEFSKPFELKALKENGKVLIIDG